VPENIYQPQQRAAWNPPVKSGSHDDWRVAVLERRSAQVTARAAAAGTPIQYLGIAPLFCEPVAYSGPQTDWVIGPATGASDDLVPRAVRQQLLALDESGICFPLVYVAHEVPKGKLPLAHGELAHGEESRPAPVRLDRATADAAVGPVPPAASAIATADRLGRTSQVLLTVLGKVVPVAAAALAVPFVIAGAAVSALAALDPIVFGVIPAGPPVSGRPAAWYVLARWDWD
jgi:hypothetical protein